MKPRESNPDAKRTRRPRKDRKPRVDAFLDLMAQKHWNATDLAAHTGLSRNTIDRLLNGHFVHADSAEMIETALKDLTSAALFESPFAVERASSEDASQNESRLDQFYARCETSPLELRSLIRIHESRFLIANRLRGFVGRQWLFDALDRFLANKPQGYFVVRGAPGVGKTSFAATVTDRRACPHHFLSRLTHLDRTDQFLANLCSQLIVAYDIPQGNLPARATHDSGYLIELLTEAARRNANEKVVVVVDAIDERETLAHDRANPLALPPELPANTYFVLTTRDTDDPLRSMCAVETVYLEQLSADNLGDIRLFIEAHLDKPGIRAYIKRQRLNPAGFSALLEERSQGNFMYLHYVLPEIERGRYTRRNWQELPAGLLNYYESHWTLLRDHDRTAWFTYKLPILRALATAPEAVSVALLADRLQTIPRDVIHEVVQHDWRQFLEQTILQVAGKPVVAWKLYHPSFADFLRGKSADPAEQLPLDRDRDAWFDYGRRQGITPD